MSFQEDTIQLLAGCYQAHIFKPAKGTVLIDQDGVQIVIRMSDNMVCVAGTNEMEDWLRNFDLPFVPNDYGVGKVHRGYKRYSEKIWDLLVEFLDPKTVWKFGGHSMGGPVACLLAYRFNRVLRGTVGGVWTFGSPKFCNKEFANDFDLPCYRVINGKDFVPILPFWGAKLGKLCAIGKEGFAAWMELIDNPRKVHSHQGYAESLGSPVRLGH